MQSWLGIISGYYPWSVSCKMYTLCRCRRHSLQLSVLPVGLSHWATVQHSPPHLLFCSPELVVSAVKGVQLWAAGKYDAAPYRSSATRAALWTAGGQRLVSPGWQEKLTHISHTSSECSKPHTGPALSSGILKINFATFSKEDLQGTCHERLSPGSGFCKGDFYTYSSSAAAIPQTFASGIICLPSNPDFNSLI